MNQTGLTIFSFDTIDWLDERRDLHSAQALIEEAEHRGALRKSVSHGEGGAFRQFTTMPGGFEVPTHSHDRDEPRNRE